MTTPDKAIEAARRTMNVLEYAFPDGTRVDLAFPTMGAPPDLVLEAKKGGFYNGDKPANRLFSAWFFGGLAKTPDFKDGVDLGNAQQAMNWAVCFMRSWAPSHEDKEAVCALIFDAALNLSNIDDLRRKKKDA